jgi:hypothetical protein
VLFVYNPVEHRGCDQALEVVTYQASIAGHFMLGTFD